MVLNGVNPIKNGRIHVCSKGQCCCQILHAVVHQKTKIFFGHKGIVLLNLTVIKCCERLALTYRSILAILSLASYSVQMDPHLSFSSPRPSRIMLLGSQQ